MPLDDPPIADPLRERLGRALGSRYVLERALGAGGMGVVYLARDLTLDRPVAVKVIPPELATAVAVERFHREAKTLADLTHPNVVPVYDFGESEGLLYYLMQYVEGETLAARLQRGPLSPAAALAMATQLLEALEAAHRRGIVHRDVKPSNVMLIGERVLLTDFGIAKRPTARDETLTDQGAIPGTPVYMAPEATWGEATPRSDIYSAGMVIYEALTGRQWQGLGRPADADWSGVPARLRGPLTRALALAPADRWPDAGTFNQALVRRRPKWSPSIRVAVVASSLLVVTMAVLIARRLIRADESQVSQLVLVVPRLDYAGPADANWVADSITARIRRSLAGPDVVVVQSPRGRTGGSLITGTVTVSGDTVHVALAAERSPLPPVRPDAAAAWSAVADSAALGVWHEVWKRLAERGPIPFKTIPRDPRAFERFVHGERLFALARWRDAEAAYAIAEARDSGCLLCSWRLHDVARWLSYAPDEGRYRRLLQHVDSFPPHYRAVIRAAAVPTVSRVDSLRLAVKRWPDFWTAWFHLAEELFHRGPLLGYPRRDAEPAYVRVTQLDPLFAPAWHHLAWLRTAEGDRPGAQSALAQLRRAGPPDDPYSVAFTNIVEVSFAWRFLPPDSARALTETVLADPRLAQFPDVGAGARFLVGFDAPEGAIMLARLLEERDLSPVVSRSALLATVLGNVALGRPSAAREAVGVLRAISDNPELALFAAQLDAVLALFGPLDPADVDASAARLEEHLVPYPGAATRVRRAAYLAVLLAREARRAVGGAELLMPLSDEPALGTSGTRPFTTLLDADARARRGDWGGALARSLALIGSVDSSETVGDPFFRTVHHVKRAEWYARQNNVEFAYRELRWFENFDIAGGYPTGDATNAEVDWAFGTEARWRRARLLDGADRRDAVVCDDYRSVVRHWSEGEPAYAQRADTARARLATLGCPE